jgi:hypothetical protein
VGQKNKYATDWKTPIKKRTGFVIMFLPFDRRLLEADESDIFINSTSGSLSISSGGPDNVLLANSSYNASGEGMIDFGEADLGKL